MRPWLLVSLKPSPSTKGGLSVTIKKGKFVAAAAKKSHEIYYRDPCVNCGSKEDFNLARGSK